MDIVYSSPHRFGLAPDGSVWSWYFGHDYFESIFGRTFDRVIMVARTSPSVDIPTNWRRSDSRRVIFPAQFDYNGPVDYVRNRRKLRSIVQDIALRDASFLLRPGHVSFELARQLRRRHHPYGIEVVGDVQALFRPEVMRVHLLGLRRCLITWETKWLCRHAATASYVTQAMLQQEYPCPGPCFATSDVDLPPSAYAEAPKMPNSGSRPFRLVTVGSYDSYVKGPDILLRAVHECISRRLNLELTIIGDGRLLPNLKSEAVRLQIGDRVRFTGFLTCPTVLRQYLDESDVFVLPSRTEGTPRALLEAMARGLPCIATAVGGIPEVLDDQSLVPPNDHNRLANIIQILLSNPSAMAEGARRNLDTARRFTKQECERVQGHFHRCLRKLSLDAIDRRTEC